MISMQFKFRMMSVLAILALMFSISGASPVLAAVYMLIDLGTLGGSNSGDISATNAVAINEIGQVIGSSETAGGEIHAFVWENGLMTDLILDGTGSDAIAINGAGQVVGNSRVAGGETHAFLWDNSVVIDLGTLGGRSSAASAINEAGQVIGSSETVGGETHAFIWESRTMIDLRTLGGRYSKASAINEAGQVIGSSETADSEIHAFVWENGTMTALTLGGNGGDAMAINEAGQVVGYSETAGGEFRAFIWENGKMTDLGTLGGNSSAASAINEAGQVIGSSETAGGEIHAFIWESGTMTDLGAAGVLSYATAINEAGQVLGYISVTEFLRHAFVWENGTITNLTLGGNHSIASDLNEVGQVVGYSETAGGELHAFVWESGSITDLGTLGGSHSFAFVINEAGQILGASNLAGNVEYHAFIAQATALDQTITVTTNAPDSLRTGDVFTVEATASSGLPVSYSASGSCTNTGADFTMSSGTGVCMVLYDQAGDASHNPAPQVIETVMHINSAPLITEGESIDLTMPQTDPPTRLEFTLHATDVDGATFTWGISRAATHGTASDKTNLPQCMLSAGFSCGYVSYIPISGYSGADSFDVQVSDGDLTDTITVNVTIGTPVPVPIINSISPASAQAGGPDLTLSVTGADFAANADVRWYNPSTNISTDLVTAYSSPSSLSAVVPSSLLTSAGTFEVRAFNPAPGGGLSTPLAFFVTQSGAGVTSTSSDTSTSPTGTATASTGGSGAGTPGSVTATAIGSGTIIVSVYDSNPVGISTFTATGDYFDVYVSQDSNFTEITLVICNMQGNAKIRWWNGSAWILVSPQSYGYGCVTMQLSNTSTPTISQLTGTVFGVEGYTFSGFLSPVNNPNTINTGKAGKTYPIKWQLTNGDGLFISGLLAVTSITHKSTVCDAFTGDPTDALETSVAGGTSLRYDNDVNQFVYNWATPRAGCYTLFLKLDTGQTFHAYFNLK